MLVRHGSLAVLALTACAAPPAEDTVAQDTVAQDSRTERCGWAQWGQNAAHDGAGCVRAQPLATQRAHLVIDPFVDQEVAEAGFGADGPLLTHRRSTPASRSSGRSRPATR